MIELLLELKMKYQNDQEFGRKVRQVLSDEKCLELSKTNITEMKIVLVKAFTTNQKYQ